MIKNLVDLRHEIRELYPADSWRSKVSACQEACEKLLGLRFRFSFADVFADFLSSSNGISEKTRIENICTQRGIELSAVKTCIGISCEQLKVAERPEVVALFDVAFNGHKKPERPVSPKKLKAPAPAQPPVFNGIEPTFDTSIFNPPDIRLLQAIWTNREYVEVTRKRPSGVPSHFVFAGTTFEISKRLVKKKAEYVGDKLCRMWHSLADIAVLGEGRDVWVNPKAFRKKN